MLLRNNGIRVNELELEFQLPRNSSYVNLNSITGVLDLFAIENYSLDIPKGIEPSDLFSISSLTVVKTNEHDDFAMLSRQGDGFLLSFDGNNKKDLFES